MAQKTAFSKRLAAAHGELSEAMTARPIVGEDLDVAFNGLSVVLTEGKVNGIMTSVEAIEVLRDSASKVAHAATVAGALSLANGFEGRVEGYNSTLEFLSPGQQAEQTGPTDTAEIAMADAKANRG